MTYVVLVILAVLWGAYFVSWYRSRAADRVDSVARFSRHLSVLEQATPMTTMTVRTTVPTGSGGVHRISSTPRLARPAATIAPQRQATLTLSQAYQRRRTVLGTLAVVALATLVGAVLAGGLLIVAHLLADALLVAYVVLLAQAQRAGAERRAKVHHLPAAGRHVRQAEPALAFSSRTATGG